MRSLTLAQRVQLCRLELWLFPSVMSFLSSSTGCELEKYIANQTSLACHSSTSVSRVWNTVHIPVAVLLQLTHVGHLS